MATGVNRVILIGNLGKDPDIMTLESGVKKASFSLATTESYKNKDGSKAQITEWHNIVLWRGLAEVAESYLKKGHQIYLEGKIRTRSWDDKDGNKRYTTEILGDNMLMLGRPSGAAPAEDNGSQQETSDPVTMDIPEAGNDLPF